jgi:hypothetical protein
MHPLPMATQTSEVALTELQSDFFKKHVSPLIEFPSVDSVPKYGCKHPAIVRVLVEGLQKGCPDPRRQELEPSNIGESERGRGEPSRFVRPFAAKAPIRWDLKKHTAREGEERNGLLQR